ncbi:MAG: asparagine synthase C-terminal domain-containing protein [Casimicrobiaceae bacterium]
MKLGSAIDRRTPAIVRGSHRFTDPELARIAADRGAEDAWLAGFERHGHDVVHKVDGDFAVVLGDTRGRRFAAVDRFAIHPLCFRMDGGQLVAGERADDVADSGADLDPQAIFEYLFFHVIPAPRTIFSGTSRLPAGHYALMEDGALTVARWWNPVFVEDAPVRFDELRGEFNQLLRECVAHRLDGRRVGCFLSGGTDSSTVAGIVTELAGRPASTYSIGFDAQGYDEMAYARIAARHFGTDHHEYYVTADDVVASIPAIAAGYDQPFGNSSVVPAYYCAKMARDDGIELMLAGDGGDELFGGNTRYAKQRVLEGYASIPGAMRRSLVEPALTGFPALERVPGIGKAVSYVRQARVPMPDRLEMYNLMLRLGLPEVLAPAFLAKIDVDEPQRQQRAVYGATSAHALINRMLAYDWKYTLADNDLPKVLGAAMRAGVCATFPLLDDRLVDFSLRLPPRFKLRGSKLRWFFKEALRGFLPDAILAKKKHGFGLPFGVWATRHPALRDLAFDSIRSLGNRGIVRPDFVGRLIGEYLPQHPGYYGELVWVLMTLELWLHAREGSTAERGLGA